MVRLSMPQSRTPVGLLGLGVLTLIGVGVFWPGDPRPVEPIAGPPSVGPDPLAPAPPSSADAVLRAESAKRADRMRRELGDVGSVIDDCPYVVGGNLSAARLETVRRDVIRPVARALQAMYFNRRLPEPLRLYLFADETSYRAGARQLFGDTDVARFGYYRRVGRALLADLSTGDGTLVHELVHALMEPDFPGAPDWFNEGLGSLYEQCRFEGAKLRGRPNWRLPLLHRAASSGRLPALAALFDLDRGRFYGEGSPEHYALARALCLHLEQRGLLERFYRRFRDRFADDPTGRRQLLEVTQSPDLAALELDFHRWLAAVAEEPFPPSGK